MKFILVFSLCSGITGFCFTPMKVEQPFNSWAECVTAGAKIIIEYAKEKPEQLNREKMMISYFCSEHNII